MTRAISDPRISRLHFNFRHGGNYWFRHLNLRRSHVSSSALGRHSPSMPERTTGSKLHLLLDWFLVPGICCLKPASFRSRQFGVGLPLLSFPFLPLPISTASTLALRQTAVTAHTGFKNLNRQGNPSLLSLWCCCISDIKFLRRNA